MMGFLKYYAFMFDFFSFDYFGPRSSGRSPNLAGPKLGLTKKRYLEFFIENLPKVQSILVGFNIVY